MAVLHIFGSKVFCGSLGFPVHKRVTWCACMCIGLPMCKRWLTKPGKFIPFHLNHTESFAVRFSILTTLQLRVPLNTE